MQNFFRMQQATRCPVCKKDWPGDQFVGERAITSANNRQSANALPDAVPSSSAHNSQATGPAEASSEEDEG